MYDELSDSELVGRFRQCQEEEKKNILLTLYERYKFLVLKVCYHYLEDYDTANDVFHDVFIRVIEHVETINNPPLLKSWIMTITRNLCVDQLRKTSSLKGQMPLEVQIEVSVDERVEDRFVAELDKQKILTHLSACILRLDAFQLRVLRLRWQGLKGAQIVRILKTEKSELRRSYDRIKRILEACMQTKGLNISIEQIISLGEIDE
jgi:RNA polymerase sigma-70 factor (ECF subfamily)